MRRLAFASAMVTTAILALACFLTGISPLGYATIVLGAVWLLILWKSEKRTELSALLGMETVVAVVSILYGASVYLAGIAIVLAIVSWDFALTEASIVPFSATMTKQFAVRHAIRMGTIAAISIAFLAIAPQIHIHLGFRTALGLGLGAFMLLAILLKLVNRRGRRKTGRRSGSIDRLLSLKDAMKEETDDRSDRPS